MPREKPNAKTHRGARSEHYGALVGNALCRALWILTSSRTVATRASHARSSPDLLALLQREALLALAVRALAIVCNEPQPAGKSKPRPLLRRDPRRSAGILAY